MVATILATPNLPPAIQQRAILISNQTIIIASQALQEQVNNSYVPSYTPPIYPFDIGSPSREIEKPNVVQGSCTLTGTIHKPPIGLFWDSQTGAIHGANITFSYTLQNMSSSTPGQLYVYGVDYNGKEWIKINSWNYGWGSFNAFRADFGNASCYAYFPDSYTDDPDGNTSIPTPVEPYQPAS